MSVEIKTDLDSGFEKLVFGNRKLERKAARSGGEIIANTLERVTPYEDENKWRSWLAQRQFEEKHGKSHKEFKHLKDDITYRVGSDDRVKVGFGKDTAWRAHFIENGTSRTGGMVDRNGKRKWGKGIVGQHMMKKTIVLTRDALLIDAKKQIENGLLK